MAYSWVERGFFGANPFSNNGLGRGYQTTVTLAAGGSEIVPLPAGWKAVVYAFPTSGGTAVVYSTCDKEDNVASTTRWFTHGNITVNTVVSITNECTGLKLTTATQGCIFDIIVYKS